MYRVTETHPHPPTFHLSVPEAFPRVCRGSKVLLSPLRLSGFPAEMDSDDREACELYFHDRKTAGMTRPESLYRGACRPWDIEGEEILERHVCTESSLSLDSLCLQIRLSSSRQRALSGGGESFISCSGKKGVERPSCTCCDLEVKINWQSGLFQADFSKPALLLHSPFTVFLARSTTKTVCGHVYLCVSSAVSWQWGS